MLRSWPARSLLVLALAVPAGAQEGGRSPSGEAATASASLDDVPAVLIPWPMQGATGGLVQGGEDQDPLIPLLPPIPQPQPQATARAMPQPSLEPVTPARAATAGGEGEAGAGSSRKGGGGLTETELGVLVPGVRVPSVGARVAVSEMTPPTEDVRRWQFERVDGLTWESEQAMQEGEWVVLRGEVDVRAGIERIRADEIRLNVRTRKLEAEGNVVLDRLDSRLTGRRLEYDTATNTGVMFDAMGYTSDDLSFTADIAEKVAENKYVLRGATFTSCTQPAPIWQVNATKAVVEIERFAYLWNPRVRFGKIPLSYLPWVAFPIKQDRSTGFMIPSVSSSSRRGTSVSEEFFWAISRSTDLTVGGTWWQRWGWRADAQARWFLPGMSEYGYIEGIYLRANKGQEEPRVDPERYLINWEHRQRLGKWDLTFTGEIGTDPLVDEFDGLLGSTSQGSGGILVDRSPILNQRLTLQRRFGKSALNIVLEDDERGSVTSPGRLDPAPGPVAADPLVDGTQTTINRSLPLVEWRTSGVQLGGRTWATFDLEASVASLTRGVQHEYEYPTTSVAGTPFPLDRAITRIRPMLADHDYMRADVHPQFSFPLGSSFLRVIPEVNFRATHWTRVETDGDTATPLTFNTVSRVVPIPDPIDGVARETTISVREGADEATTLFAWDAGVRVEGPDFERIFNADAEPGQRKWQHLVEPSIEYAYAPELDHEWLIQSDARASHYQQRFPTLRPTIRSSEERIRKGGLNEARLRLVNTIRNKRVVPPGSSQEQPRDVVIWTLSGTWELDRDEQEFGFPYGPEHDEPFDCDADGDTLDRDEARGRRCLRVETRTMSNIQSDFNIRPTDRIYVSLRNTYDVIVDDVTSTSLTGGFDWDSGYVDVAFSSNRDRATLSATRTEASVTGEHWFYKGGRVRLGYDLTREIDGLPSAAATIGSDTPWIYKRFVLSYYNQCVGLSLSWEDNAHRSIQRDREWTFIVSLKELGNFLRYRHRGTSGAATTP